MIPRGLWGNPWLPEDTRKGERKASRSGVSKRRIESVLMKSRVRIAMTVAAIAVLWVGITLVVAHENRSLTCTSDLRMPTHVDDWEWSRDNANDCEWTLIEGLRRAPESVYTANGNQPPANQREVLGWVVPPIGSVPGAAIATGLGLLVVGGFIAGVRWVLRQRSNG